MATFCEQAWEHTAGLLKAIHNLPFNVELAEGSLSRERFCFYIHQDAIYLGQFSRVLNIAAAKAPDTATLQSFAQFSLGAVAVEQALHEHYLRQFAFDPAAIESVEPAPDCFAYTSFLLAAAYHEPWEVLVAALLPCFRIYWDIGLAIASRATLNNPYRAWIDTYADQNFGQAVQSLMEIVDSAATAAFAPRTIHERMLAAYRRAAQYEYLFWDGAYNLRIWPVVEAT